MITLSVITLSGFYCNYNYNQGVKYPLLDKESRGPVRLSYYWMGMFNLSLKYTIAIKLITITIRMLSIHFWIKNPGD